MHPFRLIRDPGGLRSLAADLKEIPRAGVDTESNSLHAYRERVCLLQISTSQQDYLVDPLALADLSPLRGFFADRAVEKIFHAAEYDLLCLRRDFGFRVKGLFDTHAASRSLGRRACGLNSLLVEEFGIPLDKPMQRANWGRRPLSQRMMEYARRDTHYLPALRDRLAVRIDSAGLWEELRDEFVRLENIPDSSPITPDVHPFWKLRGAYELSRTQRTVLFALHTWREREAERIDRPPFHILSEEAMLRLAKSSPATLEDLAAAGLSRRIIQRRGKAILQAVKRNKQAVPPAPTNNGRLSEKAQIRLEAVRKWRKRRAAARGVESDVILCRDAMFRIARAAPKSLQALGKTPGLGSYRLSAYGEEILAALKSSTG
jgi:ribonuclease D